MLNTATSQLPFAASVALNRTAKAMAAELREQLPEHLDRPTPFTMRAFGMKASTKARLKATVLTRDIQAGYLIYQVRGGTRKPHRRAIPVPVTIRRNRRYGNMARHAIKNALANPHTFSGRIKGVDGIWQRVGRGRRQLKLLVAWERSVEYRKRFPFMGIATQVHARKFNREFYKAYRQALKSRR